MALKELVKLLQTIQKGQLKNTGAKLVQEHVVYPTDWNGNEMELNQAIWRETKGYNLRLSAFLRKTLSEITPLLTSLLKQAREMQFAHGAFEMDTEVYWPTEKFIREHDLGSFTEVIMLGSFYTCDPTKMRIGFPGKLHELKVKLKGKSMQISVKGDYATLLPKLIRKIKPQFATIRLSTNDAQRLLNKTKGFRKWILKRALKPKKRDYLALQMSGVVSFEEKEEIEITIAASTLSAYAEAIGKPLINEVTDEKTFIVGLTKIFLRKSQILSTLQSVVRIINELNTQKVFNHSLLTTSQAKEMLEKEIDLVSQSYEHIFFFGMNTHIVRGSLVKRLAREYFGDDILVPFDKMDDSQYLVFLQSQGFNYNGEAEKENESPYILKEIYLLQFLCQSYAMDPRDLVERFRQYYVNSAPTVKITGKAEIDATNIVSFSMPTQALLSEFSLKEHSNQGDNEISIIRSGEDNVYFCVCVSLDSCKLLDLQEEVCKKIGMVCC